MSLLGKATVALAAGAAFGGVYYALVRLSIANEAQRAASEQPPLTIREQSIAAGDDEWYGSLAGASRSNLRALASLH